MRSDRRRFDMATGMGNQGILPTHRAHHFFGKTCFKSWSSIAAKLVTLTPLSSICSTKGIGSRGARTCTNSW